MRRPASTALRISKEHAAHALGVLMHEGKIAAQDVAHALKRREELIRELRDKLATLEEGIMGGLSPSNRAAGRKVARVAQRKARKPISAARQAGMRRQGRYLAALRPLSKPVRAKIKAIREKSGVTAAIAAAKRMATRGASGAAVHRGGVRSSVSNKKSTRSAQKALDQGDVQGTQPDFQSPKQRKLAEYQQRERPKPDKHGGSGAGRQQGGSSASRERG